MKTTALNALELELDFLVDDLSEELRTREAASSTFEDTYRVATTVSPSVMQKFMRLG